MEKTLILDPIWFKTLILDPKLFSWVLSVLVVRQYSKLSYYAISRKTNEPNFKKWQNPNFGPDFGPIGPNLGPDFFVGFTSTSN